MVEAYYPRHGGEQGVAPDEVHTAWLEDRVVRLERLLREVARDYVGECVGGCLPGCTGERIREELARGQP